VIPAGKAELRPGGPGDEVVAKVGRGAGQALAMAV